MQVERIMMTCQRIVSRGLNLRHPLVRVSIWQWFFMEGCWTHTTCKIVPPVNVLASKPNHLSLTPGTHMEGAKNQLPQLSSDFCTHTLACASPHPTGKTNAINITNMEIILQHGPWIYLIQQNYERIMGDEQKAETQWWRQLPFLWGYQEYFVTVSICLHLFFSWLFNLELQKPSRSWVYDI